MDKQTIRDLYNLLQKKLNEEIIRTDKYKEILGRCDIADEILKNSLTREEYSLYEDVMNIYSELMDFETEEGFVKGFSIANKLRDESLER